MNLQTLVISTAIVTSVSLLPSTKAHANGFEPTSSSCLLVGKELKRVNDELRTTKSDIQKSWLKRHLTALRDKRSSCTSKGFRV